MLFDSPVDSPVDSLVGSTFVSISLKLPDSTLTFTSASEENIFLIPVVISTLNKYDTPFNKINSINILHINSSKNTT